MSAAEERVVVGSLEKMANGLKNRRSKVVLSLRERNLTRPIWNDQQTSAVEVLAEIFSSSRRSEMATLLAHFSSVDWLSKHNAMNTENEIRQRLLSLASARQGEATFCPSEVARSLGDDWRGLMPLVREVADELMAEGVIECSQRGRIIPSATQAKGPIRLRLRRVSTAD